MVHVFVLLNGSADDGEFLEAERERAGLVLWKGGICLLFLLSPASGVWLCKTVVNKRY